MAWLAVAVVLEACGEPQDRITNVQWMADGQIAIVNFRSAKGNDLSYRLECKDNSVKTPFSYAWEDDCDLNTKLNGRIQDWDNPEDERFENERIVKDKGINLGAVALGATAGSMLSSSKTKKKSKNKTSTKPRSKTQSSRRK